MIGMFESLKVAARKRAEFRRTVAELSQLDRTTARDLGINPGNVHAIAHQAVYGG